MNWVAVSDRLPPHGQVVLTWCYDETNAAIYMDGNWFATSDNAVRTQEVYERCGMGCCGEWKDEDVELDNWPTHWAEIEEPIIE